MAAAKNPKQSKFPKKVKAPGGVQTAATPISTSATPSEPTPPQAPDIQAERDPRLESLADQYGEYVGDIKTGTGEIADIIGTRTRDAMAGTQQSAAEMAELRGAPLDVNQLAAEEGRAVQGALGNVRLQREALLGNALSGAVGAAQAPVNAALAEKNLGLGAYSAYQNAMSMYNSAQSQNAATAYNQMLALLDAQRTSPVYDPALAAQPNESQIKSYAKPAQGTLPTDYGQGGTNYGSGTGAPYKKGGIYIGGSGGIFG